MMLGLGPLAFAAPWALFAVVLLPVLWWLLRVTPPAPRLVRFPAARLLFGLDSREDSAARTPWWVLALRLMLALLVILAAARPLINPAAPDVASGHPLVLVMDDGWAAARDWDARQAHADSLLAAAERAGQPVIVMTTAPPADGTPLAVSTLMPAARARPLIQALRPKPWPADYAAARALAESLPRDQVMRAVWIADGIDPGAARDFASALQLLGGGLDVVAGRAGRLLLPPADDSPPDRMEVVVRRLTGLDDPERVAVRGLDGGGRALAHAEGSMAPGQSEVTLALRLPTELRNRLVRLDVEGERGAGSVVLLDERWRRRTVGLAGGQAGGAPLLKPLYYVDRALAPHAELHRGEVADLLDRQLSMLVMADLPQLQGSAADRVKAWVERGGVLVRFAGPVLAQAVTQGGGADPLMPVRLRAGGRTLGGAMSWTSAQGLAPFPEDGPFAGLTAPDDVRVGAQVLAEPTLDLAEHTWARLSDGTPLVTGARLGRGWVVLVHTTANADWSNLALSGVFPHMLRRLAAMADGTGAARSGGTMPPVEVLDGFGRLTAPQAAARAVTDPAAVVPGPRHPPGLYGGDGARVAINLGPLVGTPRGLEPPPGVALATMGTRAPEMDLRGPLLAAALALFIADLLLALALRGLLARRATAAAMVLLLAVFPARAADDFALQAVQTRLAYVITGDAAVDDKSRAGLAALSRVVADRSTAALAAPMAVDLERDPVLFFPLLYWPVTDARKPLSDAALDRLNDYLLRGGLIVFDTGAQGGAAAGHDPRLGDLAEGLILPPLAPVDENHVLTRSFYLLRELPGRFDGGPVWVAASAAEGNDGVSPVVVGSNDWAGAWAATPEGLPLFATVPGGERQRELAYRFGVNLVMYALTGNYKSDQVHLPAILERLGR